MLYCFDFCIENLKVNHRRTLLSLATIRVGDFEPVYLKVPKSTEEFPVGMVVIADCPNNGEMIKAIGNKIAVEIYYDNGELDLICAGNFNNLLLEKVTEETKTNIAECMVLKYQSIQMEIPLFHKTQGKFVIEAGYVYITMKVFLIEVEKFQEKHKAEKIEYVCELCNPMENLSFEIPTVNIPSSTHRREEEDLDVSFEIKTPHDGNNSDEESMDTKEEGDDEDPIDQFVFSFLSRTSLDNTVTSSHPTLLYDSQYSLPTLPSMTSSHLTTRPPQPPGTPLKSKPSPSRNHPKSTNNNTNTNKRKLSATPKKKNNSPNYLKTTKAFDSQRLDKYW